MKRLRILTSFSVLLAAGIFFFKKRVPTTLAAGKGMVIPKEWMQINKYPLTPQKDIRPADQTFLTFPEWYLVFSPAEQAAYFKMHTATTFPYLSHTAQIWQSYRIVYDQIKHVFPYNQGYHFMIWVIGTSASIEYTIKASYEIVAGRISDTHEVVSSEDRFNAEFTQQYVDFIKDNPWYEFDFRTQLVRLWKSTSFTGDHLIRKLERRYILTSELLVKIAYGKLIKMGTGTVYDAAIPTTAVLLDSVSSANADLSLAKKSSENAALIYLPRYDKFAPAICALAKKGFSFREIAGNNSAILLTVIVPASVNVAEEGAQIVFTQPVASDPDKKRVAIATPVPNLAKLLTHLNDRQIGIEHVFDY
jgi:hypothetical protein